MENRPSGHRTDPDPEQGSSVANFELYPTQWLGLELCDPNSNPCGPCTASSNSNVQGVSGSAFLELQFYPPGSSAAPISGPPSNASFTLSPRNGACTLHINTFQNNAPFVKNNCLEPTIAQLLTTNGSPSGPTLFMSNGDSLVVTIHDTTNGLQTDVNDLTSGVTGTMVASAANGFTHNTTQSANGVCSVTTTTVCTQNGNYRRESCVCAKQAYTYHPMWNTAQPGSGAFVGRIADAQRVVRRWNRALGAPPARRARPFLTTPTTGCAASRSRSAR